MATDCPNMRRQHCLVALGEYLELREALAALEAREAECQCDLDNFHTCDLCFEVRAKRQHSQALMQSWGDSWAVLLRSAMTKLEELHQFLDDLGSGAPDATRKRAAEIRREYLAQAETVIQSLQLQGASSS
jgi:hypothetical protein